MIKRVGDKSSWIEIIYYCLILCDCGPRAVGTIMKVELKVEFMKYNTFVELTFQDILNHWLLSVYVCRYITTTKCVQPYSRVWRIVFIFRLLIHNVFYIFFHVELLIHLESGICSVTHSLSMDTSFLLCSICQKYWYFI